MCGGTSRPSNGGRIAVLFSPFKSPETEELYTLFFHDTSADGTKATFQSKDDRASGVMRRCGWIDLRIEKYGVLASSAEYNLPMSPLHSFRLNLGNNTDNAVRKLEFDLPALDLGVSETGIVGRQVTLLGEERALGVGIVGYN